MQPFEEFLFCKKIVNFYEGLEDVSVFKKKLEELSNSDGLKKELAEKAKLAAEEMTQQDIYRNNFVLKDLPWWTAEIKKLNGTKNRRDETSFMNKRLLSFLSLLAYMNCSADMQQKDLVSLEKHLKIYEMAEPENSEHQYMYAELYAIKKDPLKVNQYLKKAFELGFNDEARIKSDAYLADYDWQKIESEVKPAKK